MVARYSEVLTGGQFDPTAQALVVTAVNAITLSATPTAAQLLQRAQMAAYLMLSSYHFQVQR
jgi:thiamine biosynthesis lipoprotein ApbE